MRTRISDPRPTFNRPESQQLAGAAGETVQAAALLSAPLTACASSTKGITFQRFGRARNPAAIGAGEPQIVAPQALVRYRFVRPLLRGTRSQTSSRCMSATRVRWGPPRASRAFASCPSWWSAVCGIGCAGSRQEGHTHSQGNRLYNIDLSDRRAQSVMRWLIQHGIEADRLTAQGFGPDRPIENQCHRRGPRQKPPSRLRDRRRRRRHRPTSPVSNIPADTIDFSKLVGESCLLYNLGGSFCSVRK